MTVNATEMLEKPVAIGPSSRLPSPCLLFLGDVTEVGYAKTAFGLRDWARERCVGECALPGARVSTGLERLTPAEAVKRGAKGLIIGVASPGGVIPDAWLDVLVEAIEAGLDLVAGMHTRLASIPVLAEAAHRNGRSLFDVRTPPDIISVASGVARTGRRLLTVGTDCALGKKYTALALARGLRERGVDAQFRATGQTGIMIAGEGIPIDAIISDFVAGAAELLSPPAAADHLDVIEGQGSLFHPSYAAVSLGLLHGSQPDLFVVCHDPKRRHLLGHPSFALPTIAQVIAQTVALGSLTNPAIRCAGISLNTSELSPEESHAVIEQTAAEFGMPAADPVRGGMTFERLLDACQA